MSNNRNTVIMSYSTYPDQRAALKDFAAANDLTVTQVIRRAVAAFISKNTNTASSRDLSAFGIEK